MRSKLTVIAPAESIDLTRLERLKKELGVATAVNDDLLSEWISDVSDIIATYCNRVFGLETVEETFRLHRKHLRDLVLRRRPLVSIVTITEGDTALATTDYEVFNDSAILNRLSGDCVVCWPAGKLVVRYRAGYELLNGLPRSVETACITLIKGRYFAKVRDPNLKRTVTDGVGEREYWVTPTGAPAFPAEVIDLLAAHRNYRVG